MRPMKLKRSTGMCQGTFFFMTMECARSVHSITGQRAVAYPYLPKAAVKPLPLGMGLYGGLLVC